MVLLVIDSQLMQVSIQNGTDIKISKFHQLSLIEFKPMAENICDVLKQ